MFSIHNLQYIYDRGLLFKYPDLILNKGESCLVLGRSGTGKTTLLNLMAGLLTPVRGIITLNNQEYHTLGSNGLNHFRAHNIGIIWQDMHFIPSLNVMENLQAYSYFLGLDSDKERIEDLSEKLGFPHFLHKPMHLMSRGEVQRVAVARALLNNPSIILADEPTSSLDDENAKKVMQLIMEQCKNACLILVTHDQRIKGVTTKQINL